jgi:hypothetical protein
MRRREELAVRPHLRLAVRHDGRIGGSRGREI